MCLIVDLRRHCFDELSLGMLSRVTDTDVSFLLGFHGVFVCQGMGCLKLGGTVLLGAIVPVEVVR